MCCSRQYCWHTGLTEEVFDCSAHVLPHHTPASVSEVTTLRRFVKQVIIINIIIYYIIIIIIIIIITVY